MTISGIIHTKNEERYIYNAVRSLQFLADEVIVADMQSTDRTVEVAESAGAKIVRVPDYGFLEPALRHSHEQARGDWICRLDADELLPKTLASELLGLASNSTIDAVRSSQRTYFFGTEITDSGWSLRAERHIRFYRSGVFNPLADQLHGQNYISESARVFDLPPLAELAIVHFNYVDWSHFLRKMDAYTSIEAKQRLSSEWKPPSVKQIVGMVGREVHARGWKDGGIRRGGLRGITLVVAMVLYRLLVNAKAAQLSQFPDEEAVFRRYESITLNLLHELD